MLQQTTVVLSVLIAPTLMALLSALVNLATLEVEQRAPVPTLLAWAHKNDYFKKKLKTTKNDFI